MINPYLIRKYLIINFSGIFPGNTENTPAKTGWIIFFSIITSPRTDRFCGFCRETPLPEMAKGILSTNPDLCMLIISAK
ncbi:MAG: hypothetical protein KHZ50_06405 [Bacteroides ovatus]|uniref:hypothetical protein n=1 Tax=Bacteroides ovatus TaxID=28116 RepID=UPI001C03211A|nr:hypothetical protein [Bacteroides ovatus]MBS5203388.1 hypothetical protein [Bacteroides ovatus]MBT9935128.1 hypothetical protein [Bacteroides ovatus]